MADESNAPKYIIDAGIPELEGKEGYYATYLSIKLLLAQFLGREGGEKSTDPRIYLYTQLLISHITDPIEREKLRLKISNERARILKDISSPSNIQEGNATNDACFIVQGEITSWFDKFVGVTTKNLIEMV